VTDRDVDCFREEFSGNPGPAWFQYGGGGPLARSVGAAMARVSMAMTGDPMNWGADYVADRDALRAATGRLIGCGPEDIALVRSTAHGLSLLAGGLDWQRGDNVVTARREFPSNVYPWLALQDRGVEVRYVDPVDERVRPEDVFALMDDRTRVVTLSWVQFSNGMRLDARTIGEECRRRGVVFALDAIQGLGALQLDVADVQADLVAAGAVKWLLGPFGIGVCYLHPALADRLTPVTVGLGSVADPTRIFDPDLVWGTTARRFEESATAWPPIAGLLAALQLIERAGPAAIETRVLAHTRALGDGLSAQGWEVLGGWPRPGSECSGLITFRVPGSTEDVLDRLLAAGIFARDYQDTVRLSPHFYHSDEEIERAVKAVGPAPG
jgi:selenocysteine lyase/cysteine desulfurase